MSRPRRPLVRLLLPLALGACDGGGDTDAEPTTRAEKLSQDVSTIHLALDLAALSGTARLVLAPGTGSGQVVLDASGLAVSAVRVDGADASFTTPDGQLVVPVPQDATEVDLEVEYTFEARSERQFDGWMPELGVSFVWPDHCANLFPCNPALEDGVHFTMEVTGVGEGLTAVYPAATYSDAPVYMAGMAVGAYSALELGTTPSGTQLSAWYLDIPGAEEDAAMGTANLLATFDYFETVYGPYAFGPEVRSVQVDWGADSWGGMEHHPYFHVGRLDFWNEEVHIHEAAHGWFGDGVRMECWEDFVLSEGTTTYITARALEQVGGDDLWDYYVDYFLEAICEGRDVNPIVLPDETCNEIDFENDELWSLATYMKGACFYEDVADLVGADVVDEAIGEFYAANVNEPARMQEMVDLLLAKASAEDAATIERYATEWLRTEDCPSDYVARCRSHDAP